MSDVQEKNEKNKKIDGKLAAIIESLLESFKSDKDEGVKTTVEASLIRIADKRPNELLSILCDYKTNNHQKLDVNLNACILRITQFIVDSHIFDLELATLDRCIELIITDLTKYETLNEPIQCTAQEILVGIGKVHCEQIMKALQGQFTPTAAPHYMILNTIGTLATKNIQGIILFIKPCIDALLPTLSTVRQDHAKQAHAYIVGQFCEAVDEYQGNLDKEKECDDSSKYEISAEVGVAYDVFIQNWLPARNAKVSADILTSLALMFPLLQHDRVQEQSTKIIGFILNLYRRSIDRLSITQFLSSVIKTCMTQDRQLLEPVSNTLIISLFDLVCVNPDFERPSIMKGHYEVLRCFDLLSDVYGKEIVNILLMQLRNNNESERIKSVLVVTHLCRTAEKIITERGAEFLEILKQMITFEKSLKMKMVLLKIIVAFTEKRLIQDVEFVRFILKHCCIQAKINLEHGSHEEYLDFVKACSNSLHILCSTIGTIDDLLKQELLQAYLQLEYTDVCSLLAKCLSNLFMKCADIKMEENSDTESEEVVIVSPIPSPESIFVRSLALLGDFSNVQRIQNVLAFMKNFCINLNKCLVPLWNEKIPEIQVTLQTKDEALFYGYVYQFIILTIKDIDEQKFAELLVNKMADQLQLYMPVNQMLHEHKIPNMKKERDILLRIIGLCLCHVTDTPTVEAKLELIIGSVRIEQLEKYEGNAEYESKFTSAAKAIGLISKAHFDIVQKKFELIISADAVKKSSSIFSGLNFMKDNSKEIEIYKLRVLIIEAWGFVVENAPQVAVLKNSDSAIYEYLCRHLELSKDLFMKRMILSTLLSIIKLHLTSQDEFQFKHKHELLDLILKVPDGNNFDHLPLFPLILKLATNLIQIQLEEDETEEQVDREGDLLQIVCLHFFNAAQTLKSKFDSQEEDDQNSFVAKHLNLALPELNNLIRVTLELNPSPARLDDIQTVLDPYVRDRNSEARICACHVTNAALEVYMKTVKMGCEAPSKFNQTGAMLGRIVPRCIDSNATVRQAAVEILKRILEIACMYETLTIPDAQDSWVQELNQIKDDIITDDPKEIYRIAGDVAAIIATRLTNLQFVQFSKTLMYCIKDPEVSSGIGASMVLKFFMQLKGSEMFHAIPDLIKDGFFVIRYCENLRAKNGVIKSIVALTKHHPKLVCNEILAQPLPYEENIVEYWKLISYDSELAGTVIDNFLSILTSTCLYEPSDVASRDEKQSRSVTVQPFAIICAFNVMFKSDQIKTELKLRFSDLFCAMLTTVATYTNLDPPVNVAKPLTDAKSSVKSKSKYGYVPNRDLAKMVPCQIVLDTFKTLLDSLEMEQVSNALSICPTLALSTDLKNFIEILTPLAIGLVNQLEVNSAEMKQIVTVLSKYVPSPYDGQRIAAVGLYSQLVSLKPCGDISSVIILHLSSSLNDPNALVRGLCILGLGHVGTLTQHDIEKYSETSLTALLKGIDDFNSDCLINIPLESMRGLSKILQTLPANKLENFQVSLAIRIKPFFENQANDVREAAILLFGDLCLRTSLHSDHQNISEALKEQLLSNLFPFILHLSESESLIVRACKITINNMFRLIDAPKIYEMVQKFVTEYNNLNYDSFIHDFVRLVGDELHDSVSTFIDACLPFLKSIWPEIRGNVPIIIGILHHYNSSGSTNKNQNADHLAQKISVLLKDDNTKVRVKASEAIGYIYGDI
uniref:CSON014643 protein n=1 Tax=Culicoides sonorensis TaxID=179676 RepID=A0A336MNJ8_CULSO